jgi:IgA Peptidase M64
MQSWFWDEFPLSGQAVFDWEHQQLAVVSRAPGNLDVFVIGYDKKIWTTYWNDQQGWAPEPFPLPGQAVFDWEHQRLAVVSRANTNLDVFVIGYDKKIWTTFWGDVGVSATRLIDNGPLGSRYTIAIVGDGFTAWDQTAYNQAVDALVTNGIFSHDYFADNRRAFNLVRVNALSVDSGVSTKTYDAAGTVTATVNRNTMFGAFFNGDWAHCWVEDGPNTAATLQHVLDSFVPDRKITMLLLNNPGFGGCGGGGRLTLPLGVSWSTVAHEFGHALGGLADEYHGRNDVYTGGEPTPANATINTNRATLKWGWAVVATTPIPTGGDDYTPPKPAGWDDSQGVGLFEGGMSNFATGLYRPVVNCRMRTNDPRYCPVCAARMHAVTDPFLPAPPPAALPAARPVIDKENAVQSDGPYLRMRVRSESGRLSVLSAHQVDGPFVEPDPPEGAIVQEVLVGDRTVAVGDVGDRALSRSFSEPGAGGPLEHHVQALDTFDFVVRLPVEAVRGVDPRQVTIRLGQLAGREGPRLRLRSDTIVTPGFAVAPEHATITESSVNLGETELPDALASVLRGG